MERKINKKTVHEKADNSRTINKDVDKTKQSNFNEELRVVIKEKSKEQNDVNANQKTNQLAMGDTKKKKTDKPKNTVVMNAKRLQKVSEENARIAEFLTRKQLRERYTFKLQNVETNDNFSPQEDAKKATRQEKLEMQRNVKPQKTDPKNNVKEKEKDNKNDNEDALNVKEEKPTESSEDSGIAVDITAAKKDRQRKPIIKTITTKNYTTRIYKAVTFVDNDHRKRSTLEINIPTDAFKKSRKFDQVKTAMKKVKSPIRSPGRTSPERRKDYKNHALSSPDLSIAGSPTQTEVAKWVPASTDELTKPYYEAWVDTTVAAAFREEMDDTQKQLIIDSIKKSMRDKELQRTNSLDLTYENFKDESYTGRIKIRHKEHKRSKKENSDAVQTIC